MQTNSPALWKAAFPLPNAESHKYTRGSAVIAGGGVSSTGAARLAAVSALRVGAGLVTIACPPSALTVYAAALTSVMVSATTSAEALLSVAEKKKATAFLIGPGCGVNDDTKEKTLAMLGARKPTVLDADVFSIFAHDRAALLSFLHSACVLTPHEGEFSRFFPQLSGSRIECAEVAARECGCVMVLKGHETLIAAPGIEPVINRDASPWLATAGSGDVLAGIICGLLAQGMPAFEAACAGVWLHAEAARHSGLGMIAEDLPGLLPGVLQSVFSIH